MTKQELRQQLKAIRAELSEISISSEKIARWLVEAPFFKDAKTILLYRSYHHEVMTDSIWRACREAGKRTLFPKCISKTEMIAVKAEGETDFQKGMYGIMEPVGNSPFSKEEIDLILVPGIGFDKEKYRIGYGAGYYDRYLSDYRGVTVGLCYEKLCLETVFPDVYDVKLSYVVTEQGIF